MDDIYSGYFDDEPEPAEPACKSCGVPYTSHKGIQAICKELTETKDAITRSPFEIWPCQICGELTVYLEDGMGALCETCVEKMGDEQ